MSSGSRIKYRRARSKPGWFGRQSDPYGYGQNWRLSSRSSRKRGWGRYVLLGLLLAGLVFGGYQWQHRRRLPGPPPSAAGDPAGAGQNERRPLTKADLAALIGAREIDLDESEILKINGPEGQSWYAHTTLDKELQAKTVRAVRRSSAVKSSIVALNPGTGEVLALASYNSAKQPINVALTSASLPAASLFKIVTAAAAMERSGLTGQNKIGFDGAKTTLYKNQINQKLQDGATKLTLKESFAQSVNPAFGKIGAELLGAKGLIEYAERFQFAHNLNFDLPVETSQFILGDQAGPFQLAEVASGFNRTTTISPLHAAMIGALTVNGGHVLEPWLIKDIYDKNERVYYRGRIRNLGPVIHPQTAAELSGMMMAAIMEGTARRTFQDSGAHPVLSRLILGGKSGTLNNDEEQRVDWFVAWARPVGENDPQKALVVSALVVHDGLTTTNSQELSRLAIINYFEPRLLKQP